MKQKILFLFFIFLFSIAAIGQNINFTIDTAVDDGTSITETFTDGTDTYVLTVLHPSEESLDNLGGGDLVFFLRGTSLDPYTISITKNGNPTNFVLNGIDYDTLGAGTISLENQNSDVISAPTSYGVGAGAISITNATNASDVTLFTIIPNDDDDLIDFGFHNINVEILDTLGTPDIVLEDNVDIHPNPVQNTFNIRLRNSYSSASMTVEIYDISGKRVLALQDYVINTPINISNFKTGIYLAKIFSGDNRVIKKLIKQ